MSCIKIEERKFGRGTEEIWKRRWINGKEWEKEVTNGPQYQGQI